MWRAEVTWRGFTAWLVGGFAALVATVWLFVLVVDPYGVSPIVPKGTRPMLDTNQRFMYPQLIRARNHDSLVIGTSTSRLLEPSRLDAAFGGRFANLALSDGRAWEEYKIADLFLREIGPPKTLFIGFDWVWCAADADVNRITRRGFPDWMYDDNPWNDLGGVFNLRTVLIAVKRFGMMLGIEQPRFDADGYDDFTGGEALYDRETALGHIWGERPRRIVPVEPPYVPTEAERASWRYPALAWLEELLERTRGHTKVYLVFMPVHVVAQPAPGTVPRAKETECKRRIEALAADYGATYADYRVASPVTTNDDNWWDPLHWRIGIGRDLIDDLKAGRIR